LDRRAACGGHAHPSGGSPRVKGYSEGKAWTDALSIGHELTLGAPTPRFDN